MEPLHVTLIIVRHGETEYNQKKQFQSPREKLNEVGIEQAQKLAKQLKQKKKIHLILSSNFDRAIMTSQEIHKELTKNQNETIKLLSNQILAERGFGKLEGVFYSQIPKKLEERKVDYKNFPFPVGHYALNDLSKNVSMMIETEDEINKRKKDAVQFILKSIHDNLDDSLKNNSKNPFNVVVVSHGLFLSGLVGELILGENQWMPVDFDNTSVSVVGLKYHKKDEGFQFSTVYVDKLNDTSHLEINN